jgi:hypothetical protein
MLERQIVAGGSSMHCAQTRRCLWRAAAAMWILAALVSQGTLVHRRLAFNRGYTSVKPGMAEVEVTRRLGEPNEKTQEFRLGQRRGFERQYQAAASSGSHHYLLWHKFVDVTYAVGIDDQGRATMKAAGGT